MTYERTRSANGSGDARQGHNGAEARIFYPSLSLPPQPDSAMMTIGNPSPPLAGALAFLGDRLHPTIEEKTKCEIGYSWGACILSSLVARDVLRGLGFTADEAPVIFRIRKRCGDRLNKELFIGDPSHSNAPRMWNAHMVVLVESLLVDFTLAQAWRWEWPHLPRMLAATVCKDGGSLDGKFPRLLQLGDDPDEVEASWFHHPAKTDWKAVPDARPRFRKGAVRKLVKECRRRGLIR